MWVTCGISMCSVEAADGYYCELPPGEHFVLRESPCKVRISITVTPLGNVLQETAKKSQGRNIQHIRAGEYRIIAHIFSLHLQTGACALRRGSENVLEQSPEKAQSWYHH